MIEKFCPDVAHVRNIYHHLSPSILWELKQRGVPVLYHLNDFKLLCPTYNLVARGKICERCQGGRSWNVVTENCYSSGRAAGAVLAVEACVHRWLRTYEKCVTRFLAPSDFVRAKLISNGWPGDRIDVLPHFQELPAHAIQPPAPNASILYFGRLSAEKGVSDLLRALRYLPTLHLKIAGDGPSRVDLEELTRRLELKNVEFLGHLPAAELDQVIRGARFTVLPSRAYETLGKTILESYAHGRAVVASDLGSRREFVQHGRTGLLYQVGNVEELAKALSRLDQHPDLAATLGRAGREFVREHHSPAKHYQSMIELYERLATRTIELKKAMSRVVRLVPATSKPRLRVAFIGGRGVIGKYSG